MIELWRKVVADLRADLRPLWAWLARQRAFVQILVWVLIVVMGWPVLLGAVVLWTIWLFISAYAAARAPDSPQSRQRQSRRAQRDLARQVATLEKTRAELTDARGKFVAQYRGVKLWECWISTPTGEGPVEAVRATCDTASNMVVSQRATLTRMAAGGLLLGPLGAILSLGFQKKQVEDHRELYLLIESPVFACLVQCPPDEGAKARRFSMAVNLAASTSASTQEAIPARLAQVEADLARVKALEIEVRSSAGIQN
jgi:hypothetical protein